MRRRLLVPASLWVRAARLAAFALATYSAGTALAASPIGARSFRTPKRNTQKQVQDIYTIKYGFVFGRTWLGNRQPMQAHVFLPLPAYRARDKIQQEIVLKKIGGERGARNKI